MTRSVLFFCGQPLVARPVSQRIAAFGAYLAEQGWEVRLTAVDPGFDGTPSVEVDPISGLEVEIIGPTHYRERADGTAAMTSPVMHLGECRAIAQRLRARADEMQADRVLVSTTHPSSLVAIGALRWSQTVCLDADDWTAGHFTAGGGGRLVGSVYEVIERLVPRGAHRVTVCSNELATLHPNATVVPNFIPLRDVPPRPVPTGAGSGAGGEQAKVRVTFPASVTGYYGHQELLRALARRRADCGGLDVRFIGDGEALPECRRIVADEGIDELVSLVGHLDRPAMLRELVQSDVSVLPLHDNRVDRARFPLKMLDALACGAALAASDIGMPRATLTHRETALLSPAGDMDAMVGDVLELAGDPELRARLSATGLELVSRYDVDVVCARWAELIS